MDSTDSVMDYGLWFWFVAEKSKNSELPSEFYEQGPTVHKKNYGM